MTADSNGGASSSATSVGATQTWRITFKGNNLINLYNENRQKYLKSENDNSANANSNTAGNLEEFVIQSVGYGRYAFRTNQGKYLTVNGGGFTAGATSIGATETFTTLGIGKCRVIVLRQPQELLDIQLMVPCCAICSKKVI